jgi:hypothetical protein
MAQETMVESGSGGASAAGPATNLKRLNMEAMDLDEMMGADDSDAADGTCACHTVTIDTRPLLPVAVYCLCCLIIPPIKVKSGVVTPSKRYRATEAYEDVLAELGVPSDVIKIGADAKQAFGAKTFPYAGFRRSAG